MVLLHTNQQNELEKSSNLDLIVNKINDLYIMTRFKYLTMYTDKQGISKWSTILYGKLTDTTVKKHLTHKSTIGVFSGQELSKFICFDIDSPSLSYSKQLYQLLLFTLTEDFNIPLKNIVTSFSGKKGYHVEIFFNAALPLVLLESFYQTVIEFIALQTEIFGEIEFRPSFTQGVKLPLSIHKGTSNFCNYVDNETLEPICDLNYILSIEPLDVDTFKTRVLDSMSCSLYNDNFFVLDNSKAADTEEMLHEVKPHVKLEELFKEEMESILEHNHLLRNGTRNNATFYLAIYLKNIGKTLFETKDLITAVLNNTWDNHRTLISSDTSYTYMIKEVDRLVKTVYEKEYVKKNKKVKLYAYELLKILELPTKTLRKLMFSLYIHSKKYAKQDGSFFMAYSVIADMGNCKNPSIVLKHLLQLEALGFIEIVQRNKKNASMTFELNKEGQNTFTDFYETNVYKVTLNDVVNEEDTYLEVSLEDEIELVDTVVQLIDEKDAKEKLPYNQFYREYKTKYKKVQTSF